MHKVFVSYHHANDQPYKDELLRLNHRYGVFIDHSVDTGDIRDDLEDAAIRETIRDDFLQDSTVTIVLVGLETKRRKHVDWEIYSSMFDGKVNKKSGVLAINLPSTNCTNFRASHGGEKTRVYPEVTSWKSIDSRSELESRYPYMPDRIIDNLLATDVNISVVPWSRIENDPNTLAYLVDATFQDRAKCDYDLSTPMRRANS